MGSRRAVEGRDGRRLARRRETGGKGLQRSTNVGKYPGSRTWAGAEVGEQHPEDEWVRFSTARAEKGGRGGWRGGTALFPVDVRGNPALWAGMRLSHPATRAETPDAHPLSKTSDGCCIVRSQESTEGWKALTNFLQPNPQVPLRWHRGDGCCKAVAVRMHSMEEMAPWYQGTMDKPSS